MKDSARQPSTGNRWSVRVPGRNERRGTRDDKYHGVIEDGAVTPSTSKIRHPRECEGGNRFDAARLYDADRISPLSVSPGIERIYLPVGFFEGDEGRRLARERETRRTLRRRGPPPGLRPNLPNTVQHVFCIPGSRKRGGGWKGQQRLIPAGFI